MSTRTHSVDQRLADFERAEAEVARRRPGSVTFRSTREAIARYYELRAVLAGPKGMHPQTWPAADGSRVRVSVDGGRGGDLDGVLAFVASVGAAIQAACRRDATMEQAARRMWMVTARYAGIEGEAPPGGAKGQPWTQSQIAGALGCSQQTVSRELGRIESAVSDLLHDGDVVV